jgi:hypothetical protein
MSISRRNVLIGSGAAVALAACEGPKPLECPAASSPSFTTKYFQGEGNKGDEPWESPDSVPGMGDYGKLKDFATKSVCLVYMEILAKPFRINVARIYFENASMGSDWTTVESEVTTLIDRLNSIAFPLAQTSPVDPPWDLFSQEKYKYWVGLQDFAFKRQHHVIFYVKNQESEFNGKKPIWFGDKLQGKVFGHVGSQGQADWNYSFYGASRKELALKVNAKEYSKAAVYVRNHYQKLKDEAYDYIDNTTDKLVYALNINVITRTADGKLEVPMIIDPDTGNMGEGQP